MAFAPPSSAWARWAARVTLIGYAGLLLVTVHLAPGGRIGVAGAGFFDLRTGSRIRAVVFALPVYALVEVARFLPVGLLAMLSLLRARGVRTLALAGAAVLGSVIIAAIVLVVRARPAVAMAGAFRSPLPLGLYSRRRGQPRVAGRTSDWAPRPAGAGRVPPRGTGPGRGRPLCRGRARAARPRGPGRDLRGKAAALFPSSGTRTPRRSSLAIHASSPSRTATSTCCLPGASPSSSVRGGGRPASISCRHRRRRFR